MFGFAIDYYLFALAGSFGVIQVAASFGRLRGLLVFKSAVVARTLGSAMPMAAYVWFFTAETRNVNDYAGGLDGNDQALLFFLAAASATLATLLVTSLINAKMKGREERPGEGLEALEKTTYARALARSLRHRWTNWRA